MSMITVRTPSAETFGADIPDATVLAAPLEAFVAYVHQMLDPATPETLRQSIEPRLLALLPTVRALGLFELFELRHPALRAWLEDEMASVAG